jgi:hypothetical protein
MAFWRKKGMSMKMKSLLVAFAVASPFLGFADQGKVKSEKTDMPFIEYHNRISVFGPYHQAYERIKPDAYYVGVEGWVTGTLPKERALGEAELRMGYNFFYNGRCHLTPILGVGVLKETHVRIWKFIIDEEGFIDVKNAHKRAPAVVYGMLGFLYDHEFNSIFNLGFNMKGMIGGPVNKKRFNWGCPVGGLDVAMPITFRFGHKRHWDARIEPFNIVLFGTKNSRNYFGFRSTVGYRF